MNEDDVRTVMAHPSTMIGSDGLAMGGKPHPRLYGTFPRVIGHYAREGGLMSLEQAMHRMTGMAAEKFHLRDRGVIREGAYADLVDFRCEGNPRHRDLLRSAAIPDRYQPRVRERQRGSSRGCSHRSAAGPRAAET